MIKAIIFDAFGTLFKVTSGGSARTIMKNIADCGTAVDGRIFLQEWKDYYKKHTASAYEREVYPETKDVHTALKEKYLIFIGSNTDNDVLKSVMHKNNITVDEVYTSENLKCYKPNSQFYTHILKDNALSPQEVWFVGDSVTDDVLGPKSVGMKTVWVDRSGAGGDYGQEKTVQDLKELITGL